jgi:GH43 family beta-xylosidase
MRHLARHLRWFALAWLLAGCASAPASPQPTSAPASVPTDAPASAAATFFNPLNEANGADPWLQYYDGNYYLTTTQVGDIRMWKSPTLAGLATAAPAVVWSDDEPTRCCNMWAPEFHLLDGPNGKRWYLYYTAGSDGTLDKQHTHVLESAGTDPLGPYTYKAQVFDPSNNGWAIDGSILRMPDNKLYFLFSSWVGDNQNMFIAPMSDPWTISGARVLLSTPTYPWERATGNVNEGPEVLQHGGDTFIIYSASACWGPDYKLGLLRYAGGDVLDAKSWQKQDKPVFERNDKDNVYAPGHNGFFTSPDGKENWLVYHANSLPADGCANLRTTRVQPFTWNADGTPNFGTPLALEAPIPVPSGEQAAAPAVSATAYALVGRDGGQCLAAQGGELALAACDNGAGQQWNITYLGNGYSNITSPGGGALTVGGDDRADGAAIDLADWTHANNQQWKISNTEKGWSRIDARVSGRALATCDGLKQVTFKAGTACQQFRLQPLGALAIANVNSGKPLAKAPNDDTIVQSGKAGTPAATWQWEHQADGYYHVVQDGACLTRAASSAGLTRQTCGSDATQLWRFDMLNDGTIRLVASDTGKVIDIANCLSANGTRAQQWIWLNNFCQKFRLLPG